MPEFQCDESRKLLLEMRNAISTAGNLSAWLVRRVGIARADG
jgi:hypothetical protein